ncbi:MAG: hypothetical protein KFB95_05765 [Simkaniaceae bacterium]|nr:MAG: hypothetical protein KFB95_05765 [Simkaniaceae bacterium]
MIYSTQPRLDTSMNPRQSLIELQDGIDVLAATVLSQKGTLEGTIVEVYSQRFSKLQDSFLNPPEEKEHKSSSLSSGSIRGASSSRGSGTRGMVTGSRSQFENMHGVRESCSGTTLAFLDRSLNRGQRGMGSVAIDEVLDNGLGIYRTGIAAKNKQASALGVSEIDARSTQLHPYNLLDYVGDGLTQKVSPKSSQVGSTRELQARISQAIDSTLIPIAQDSNPQRAGMTMSFNGKTFALNVEINRGQVSYMFFDSHGTKDSGKKAYTFQTNDQRELLEFIGGVTEFISREPDAKLRNWLSPQEIREISKPHDGDNELGFLVVGPKSAVREEAKASTPLLEPRRAPQQSWRPSACTVVSTVVFVASTVLGTIALTWGNT